ncbi:MAG TPA: STAS domain-containing protein [Blastocatellia bacterium]|jgi:anti-anti-sigma factor|nr:STAS domain-containing protein [Blastocatellia bacterium]
MSTLDVRTRIENGVAIIYPGPYLNQLRGEGLEGRCGELLASGIRGIVINFEETELINSIGISILLGIIETVNESSGSLVLSNLSATNRELFEMLGLLVHVRIEETEEVAVAKLSATAEVMARR